LNPSVQIIAIAALAFVSTSIDNLAVLIAFFAARDLRPRRVVLGYLCATWFVAGAAWAGSKLVEFVPVLNLGFLGVIPLGLGIQRAWGLRRSAPDIVAPTPTAGGAVAVALVTLAQNADNFAVFLALFADSANSLHGAVLASLATCAAFWCAFAFGLAQHSPLAGTFRRAMRFALPFLLITVGAYILSETATDKLSR
jgi:cadmium resistance protein CadD (predicted permease)